MFYRNVNLSDNARIEIASIEASSKKKPFLMLHEGLGCVKMWESFSRALHLSTRRNVYSYSRLGYGSSDRCELPRNSDYHMVEAVEHLPSVIHSLNLNSCILVGHSDGASIALLYAALVRKKIKALILLSPHIKTENKTLSQIRFIRERYQNSDLQKSMKKYHGENQDCAFYGWSDCWLSEQFKQWNIEPYLSQVTVPVLNIRGNDDPFNSRLHVDVIRDNISAIAMNVNLDHCKHSPHRECPETVLGAVNYFLKLFKL